MDTIQELRRKAEDQGNLKTTKEHQVIIEREITRIEPANPEVVYVPVYDPLYVYGPWWYPAYPPYYWYYPPGFAVTSGFISFGPSISIGIGFFPWVWFDWPFHRIDIDIHKTSRFHRYDHRRDFDRDVWEHNPSHRKGVAYRDRTSSHRFGSRPSQVSPASPETRGYPDRRESRDRRPSQGPVERHERIIAPQERNEPASPRGAVERRVGAGTSRVSPGRERIQIPADRDTSFRGIGEGNFERKASERGGVSRQSGVMLRGEGASRKGGGISPKDSGAERKSGDSGRPDKKDTEGGRGSWR